jgi:hypothetical protein
VEFAGFPPKPPPALEGLPTEPCIQICLTKRASGDFILDAMSELNLSIASKTMYNKVHDGFLQRVVACPKYSLTPWSLDTLEKLSEHERLRKKSENLGVRPKLLKTRLEHALGIDSDGLRNDPPGNAHPDAFLNSSWPIWPVVRPDTRKVQEISGILRLVYGDRDRTGQVQENLLGVHWKSRYTSNSWQWNDQTNYKMLCEEQKTRGSNRTPLADIIARFPNLEIITLDPRPVGHAFEHVFNTYIRPSIGLKSLARAIGTNDIHLTHDPAPARFTWESKLNIDGICFNEHGEEYAVFPHLFEQLATTELEHINLHLVVPGTLRSFNSVGPFSITDKSWTSLAHRARSITLDFGAWKNYLSDIPDELIWAHWLYHMLEDTAATEHLYVQNMPYSGCCDDGVLGVCSALENVTLWSNLTTLHFVRTCAGLNERLLHLLVTHAATLENVRFQHMIIFDDGTDWFHIFRAFRGMKRLQQLALDNLGIHSHGSLETIFPDDRHMGEESVMMSWMQATDHRSFQYVVEAAILHMIYVYSEDGGRYDREVRLSARWWPTEEHLRRDYFEHLITERLK